MNDNVVNLTKLFKNLRLKLPSPPQDDPSNLVEDNTSNLEIKPKKPFLAYTNRDNYCYDCNSLLNPYTAMGTGIGIIGIDIYFCEECYMTRFHRGEGEIINYQEDYHTLYIDQVSKEWCRYISSEGNIYSKCFHCGDDIVKNKCYMMNGFLGEEYKIYLCTNCHKGFYRRMIFILRMIKNNVPAKDIIEGEISYYFYSRQNHFVKIDGK